MDNEEYQMLGEELLILQKDLDSWKILKKYGHPQADTTIEWLEQTLKETWEILYANG